MHPFWQGYVAHEQGKDLDWKKHPAWIHGWQQAEDDAQENAPPLSSIKEPDQ